MREKKEVLQETTRRLSAEAGPRACFTIRAAGPQRGGRPPRARRPGLGAAGRTRGARSPGRPGRAAQPARSPPPPLRGPALPPLPGPALPPPPRGPHSRGVPAAACGLRAGRAGRVPPGSSQTRRPPRRPPPGPLKAQRFDSAVGGGEWRGGGQREL